MEKGLSAVILFVSGFSEIIYICVANPTATQVFPVFGENSNPAVLPGNINACKHFSKGITSSRMYFIILPQI